MSESEAVAEARRWLKYAREDLAAAEIMLQGAGFVPRQACWLAQQSAEKAVKAVLVFLQIDFPRRHDLDFLRNLIPADWQVKAKFPDLAALTEWAVEARYPGDWAEATESDARTAVHQAEEIWKTVRADFGKHGIEVTSG